MFWRIFVYCTVVCSYCSAPHILSDTEHTLDKLLRSSSNEYILQMLKTKPRVGLVFLLRNKLNVDVLQKTSWYTSALQTFLEKGKDYIRLPSNTGIICKHNICSLARTLSLFSMNSTSFCDRGCGEERSILTIKNKVLGCRWSDSIWLQNCYVIVTDDTLCLTERMYNTGLKCEGAVNLLNVKVPESSK